MPTHRTTTLPPMRFACRQMPDTDDVELLLAEALALLLWAESHGCAHAFAGTWYVLDAGGALEVAVPVTDAAPADAGLTLRRPESTTFAIEACDPRPSAARACAARLHTSPTAVAWVCIDASLTAAAIHLPLARDRQPDPA